MTETMSRKPLRGVEYDQDFARTTAFFNGPGEFLCQEIVKALLAIPQWVSLFDRNIDAYKRMDYPVSTLAALRVYNNITNKTAESWFIEGDVIADLILPAQLRRTELQQVQDSLSAALMQQFRAPAMFVGLTEVVPGLNELGKRFDVDKSLGFEWGESAVPLTQMTLNFRIDLREWDLYLEETNRTKDSPFEPVLGNLERIATVLRGVTGTEAEPAEVEIGIDQKVE